MSVSVSVSESEGESESERAPSAPSGDSPPPAAPVIYTYISI